MRSMLGHSGVPDKPLGLQLCDTCQHEQSVRAAYADDPIFAQRIYCVDPSRVEEYLARERAKQERYEREEAERGRSS